MSPTVWVPLLVGASALVGALAKTTVDYVSNLQKVNADLKTNAADTQSATADREVAAWEQWRKDNTELRNEIKELRAEVGTLRDEVRAVEQKLAAAESKVAHLRQQLQISHDDAGEKALRIEQLRVSLTEAQAERDKYRDAMNALMLFYDAKIGDREADAGMLAVIEDKLRAAGCLSPPATKGKVNDS